MKKQTKSVEKVVSKSSVVKKAPRSIVQEALEVTWVLKGQIKIAQMSYLRIGRMLIEVRDKNLFGALKHKDMEDYADKRLNMSRTSLYRYLQVYDWVLSKHPEWLQPKPKGFIPDLTDITDLIWIEKQLERTNLKPAAKTALEQLKAKALAGDLRQGELAPFRRHTRTATDSLEVFLANLRHLRKQGSTLKNLPASVIPHLDAAIGSIMESNAQNGLVQQEPLLGNKNGRAVAPPTAADGDGAPSLPFKL